MAKSYYQIINTKIIRLKINLNWMKAYSRTKNYNTVTWLHIISGMVTKSMTEMLFFVIHSVVLILVYGLSKGQRQRPKMSHNGPFLNFRGP